jgi:hypothetical protein
LNAAGLAQIRHIAGTPLEQLQLLLGKQALQLRQFAHGIDERPLVPAREPAKSFSQQETFAQDLTDADYLEAVLRRMADELFAKIRDERKSIRTIAVKVRYNDMAEDQCSESLIEPTDLETDIYARLHLLLRDAWKRRVSLRMLSLKLSNVYDGLFRSELPLDCSAQQRESRERLARAVDDLRRTHGRSAVLRGHDFILKDEMRSAKDEADGGGQRCEVRGERDGKREHFKSQISNLKFPSRAEEPSPGLRPPSPIRWERDGVRVFLSRHIRVNQ